MKQLLDKLIDKVKEKKPNLANKLEQKIQGQAKGGGNGLKDDVILEPEGRIKVEKFRDGEKIKEIEEENLVVNKSFELMIRGLVGDDKDLMFLNPKLTDQYVSDAKDYVAEVSEATGENEFNIDWPRPKPEDVIWELDIIPRPLYKCKAIHYYVRDGDRYRTDLKYKDSSRNDRTNIYYDCINLTNNSVNYIGLGIDDLRFRNVDNQIFSYSGTWNDLSDSKYKNDNAKAGKESAEVTFTDDTEKLNICLTVHPEGGEMEVLADGTVIEAFSTYSSVEENNYKLEVDMSTVADGDTTLTVRNTGTSNSDVTDPTVIIEGFEKEGYSEESDSLAFETPSEAKIVDIPEYYSTTSEAPYSFYLDLKDPGNTVDVSSVNVVVDGDEFTYVSTTPTQGEQEFTVDSNGLVTLGVEAHKAAVTYETANAFDTNYSRALIAKERSSNDYPIYSFDNNTVIFEATFEERCPNYPVTIKEFGLFNLPLDKDCPFEDGFKTEEKMFSITDVEGLTKQPEDVIKVSWEITLNRP